MRYFLSGATVLAMISFASFAEPVAAQNLRSVGGPAETPPASFQGQQYVDSRGCVFMRAGLSGRISWVPRIGRDRRPICNDVTAAEASARLSSPETTPLIVPKTQNVGQPMATIASKIAPKPQVGVLAPVVVPGLVAPAQNRVPSPTYVPSDRMIAAASQSGVCPQAAPNLQRMALRTGGTVMVCTRGDGSASGWLPPNLQGVGASISHPSGQEVGFAGAVQSDDHPSNRVQVVIAGQPVQAHQVPEAITYVAAWKDGRLNPQRGIGSAQGWAAQDQVWTRTTPARSIAPQSQLKIGQKAAPQSTLRVSTASMSTRQQAKMIAADGSQFVQIGTFGNPQNVANAGGRLAALGLPVSKSKTSKSGRDLVIVFAGPFATDQDAQTALGIVRGAGFSDAFLR